MDQQLLEEAYDEVIKKMMTGANNPGWDSKRPLTSGQAFKPWSPKGGWSDKKTSAANPKATRKTMEVEPAKHDEFDVEGDPVGSFRSIATPQPEEDHTDSMLFVTKAELEEIYHADESLFERLFNDSEQAAEKPEGMVFRYLAPRVKRELEQAVSSILRPA